MVYFDVFKNTHLCLGKSLSSADKEVFITQIVEFIRWRYDHQAKSLNNQLGRIIGVLIFCFEKSNFVSQVVQTPRYLCIPKLLVTSFYELNVTLFDKV
jgi:hypothetical protein